MATRLDPELSKKLEVIELFQFGRTILTSSLPKDFRQKVSVTAEDIVFRVFPAKVLFFAMFSMPNNVIMTPLDYVRWQKSCPSCRPLNLDYSELNEFIETTSTPDSPFHLSRVAASTDATVYPPPTDEDGPEAKKRKRNTETSSGATNSNDTRHAAYPNLMLGNKHIVMIHATIKKECEQLADLVVSLAKDAQVEALHYDQDKVKLWVNLTMPK